MRKIETTIDPSLEPGMAVAEIQLAGQSRPFVISGIAESVIQAAKRAPRVKVENVAPTVEKPVKTAVFTPQVSLHGREYVRDTLKAKFFDFMYHTAEYEALEETRLLERRLRLRQELGIMPVDRCAKHQHQVDKLKA